MARNPENTGADRGDAEEAVVTPTEKALGESVARLKRTISGTQLLASEVLECLKRRSSNPPKNQ